MNEITEFTRQSVMSSQDTFFPTDTRFARYCLIIVTEWKCSINIFEKKKAQGFKLVW